MIKPKRITHRDGVTTVIWSDDTETRVKLAHGDTDNNYNAFCAAVAKKCYGCNGEVKRLLREAENAEPEPLKVGDKVKILDGSTIPNYSGGWTDGMKRYIGDICRAVKVINGNSVFLRDRPFQWDSRGLEKLRDWRDWIGDIEIGDIEVEK